MSILKRILEKLRRKKYRVITLYLKSGATVSFAAEDFSFTHQGNDLYSYKVSGALQSKESLMYARTDDISAITTEPL